MNQYSTATAGAAKAGHMPRSFSDKTQSIRRRFCRKEVLCDGSRLPVPAFAAVILVAYIQGFSMA
jgi:uncharacterized MAPEG superfamily protein